MGLTSTKIVKVASGIGDILWIIQKLGNTREKFHWRIAGDNPKRGAQIFDLLPQTVETVMYDSFTGGTALANNIQNNFNSWERISNHGDFFLTINQHFEARPCGWFKDWLPDLPITYYPNYQIASTYKAEAEALLNDPDAQYVLCYGSSVGGARAWGAWQSEEWFMFIKSIRDSYKNVIPVIVGASWDSDMASRLMTMLDTNGIPYKKMMGLNLATVVQAMKIAKYGVYFPSGLGIIAGTLGVRATMWYPTHLETMAGKWCDPRLTKERIFCEMLMPSPTGMKSHIDSLGVLKK